MKKDIFVYSLIFLGACAIVVFAQHIDHVNPKDIYGSTARLGPADIYPPANITGALNPAITQDTIKDTICNPHWSTKSIRPPSSYTTNLKINQLKQYGYEDKNTADFEEDHFVSLEIGGNPTDVRNLWPEYYTASVADGGAKSKDRVENYLHSEVCSGKITLQEAQKEVTTDWYAVYKSMNNKLGAVINDNDPDDN